MQPSVAVIMLLPQCNMSCSFCVTDDAMGTITFEQACTLLDRLAGQGFNSVVFGGGEPLAWPHGVIPLTREAKTRGFNVQLGTNGILLPEGFEQIDSIDRYVLPLDGATGRVHNAVRFYRSRHFEIVMSRLDRLRGAGKSTTVSTVVTRINRHDLPNIAQLLGDLDRSSPFLHAWHLYQFIPEGRGGAAHRERLLLDLDEYHEASDPMKQLGCRFRVFKRPHMLHSRSVEFFWMNDGALHRQLGAQRQVEAI